MLYTPQQLSGGSSFTNGVRVGNWYEDDCYRRARLKEFKERKASGKLLSSSEVSKMAILRQTVPHSFSPDNKVRYGDTIALQIDHERSPTVVACNIFARTDDCNVIVHMEDAGEEGGFVATASNTLVITRDAKATAAGMASTSEELSYGDVFYLCSNPSLTVDPETNTIQSPFYLASTRGGVADGLSTVQSCYLTKRQSRDARWKVLHTDIRRAAVYEGRPVPANQSIVLCHVSSNSYLSVQSGNLIVKSHKAKPTVKCATVSAKNHFKLMTSTSSDAAKDERTFTKATPEILLAKIVAAVSRRGGVGIRGLGRTFRMMDEAGDGLLDRADFKYGIRDCGIDLTEEEFSILLQLFDANGDGFISFGEFLSTIRGPMTKKRQLFVDLAYDVLDKDKSGAVNLKDIESAYDVSKHPAVLSGEQSEKSAMREFLATWDKNADGVVTQREFREYYADISAGIEDDDYFELMMRNVWHLSGGEGASENTTCRRVLVLHSDGSQTVEEIKNDIGVDASDVDEMKRRLEAQGVKDIRSISVTFGS
eukprot:g331.t1